MRKSVLLSLLLLYGFLIQLIPPPVFAGELTQSMIRLTRHTVSTRTGGMVCVTTPSSDNGIESSVQVIFPSGFTVNSNTSNWTVDTDDMPLGSTAWPGISTADSISGQIVTFPSSNLGPSTKYCFNFDSSNTLTNATAVGSYPATIRTRNNSNSTIDSIEIALPVVANDGISVTATVPANPTDFDAVLTLSNSSNGFFQDGTELHYILRYGSHLSIATAVTVEAEWDLGIIHGVGVPTEDILNYIVGSASNAYSNTPPVIDIVNRTISWTIPSLPANTTDQEVRFKLKTNDSYKSTLPVTFSVHGRVSGLETQTPDSTVTSNYYNSTYVTPTPTPTCVPSACPTSPPARFTPTPTPVLVRPIISSIDIRSVSSSQAAIFVATNKNVSARITYGTDPSQLTKSTASNTLALQHLIFLKGLSPRTRYFFRVQVTDNEGSISSSDIYTVDTASTSQAPALIASSFILSSGDVLLTSSITRNRLSDVIIPFDTSYAFRFGITPYQDVKSIRAVLRPDNVLGIVSDQAYVETNSIPITEINPGLYIGRLQTNSDQSNYRLVLQIQDYNGNIKEETAAKLYIVRPLTITNAATKEGIENVKTTIYFYNYRLRKYELLSTSLTAIKNPNKSNFDGIVNTVLPEGECNVELEALGLKEKSTEFIIGPNTANYPVIELVPLPFNLISYIRYTFFNAVDVFSLLNGYIDNLKASARFLELFTFGAIVLFTFLALLQLSRIYGVSIAFLPFFAIYHFISLFYKPKHSYIVQGTVLDVITNIPLEGALLHFAYTNGKIITHTRTNSNGEFGASIKDAINVKITINKRGYTPFSKVISKAELASKLTIVLGKVQKPNRFGLDTIGWYFESLAGSLFEAFLVITLILEIFFALEFGLAKALPCIMVSLANILLWALHARPRT